MFQTWDKSNNGGYFKYIHQIPSSQSQQELKPKVTNFRRSFYDGFDINQSQIQSQIDNDIFFITNNFCNVKAKKKSNEKINRPPLLPPRRNRFDEAIKNQDLPKTLTNLPVPNRARSVKSVNRKTDLHEEFKAQRIIKLLGDNPNSERGSNVNQKYINRTCIPPLNNISRTHAQIKSEEVKPLEEFFNQNPENSKLHILNGSNKGNRFRDSQILATKPLKFTGNKNVFNEKHNVIVPPVNCNDRKVDIPESKSAYDFRSLRQKSEFDQIPNTKADLNLRKMTHSHILNEQADNEWMCPWMKSTDIFQAHKNVEKDHLMNIRSLNHFLKNPEPPHPTTNYSHEEFLKALSEEVCRGDPRKYIEEVALIGEGSTAEVILAKYKPGAIDKLNKMNQLCNDLKTRKHNSLINPCVNKALTNGNFNFPNDGDYFAIKKMKIRKQQRRELMFNEIIIMRSYPHPNIVQMHSSYIVGNELWLFMEYIEGGALTNIVTEKTMEEVQIACVVKSVLLALAFLHDHGVIHRDIKSDSILLKADGTVKLSDFGFSACITPEVPRRRSLVGTPYWMAPEVLARESYNTSIDVWSTGVLIIEMVDGEPSFFNISPYKVMKIVREKLVPSLKNPNKSSPLLKSILSLMLVRNFNQRATTSQLLRHPFIATAGPQSCLIPLISSKIYK